jgi:hypothetical protein
MDKNNGGPAFPISIPGHGDNGACGMSLRDYFAAKALQAVPMPQGHQHDIPEVYARIAQHAYKMADAMLRAREST